MQLSEQHYLIVINLKKKRKSEMRTLALVTRQQQLSQLPSSISFFKQETHYDQSHNQTIPQLSEQLL